ncbi:MAG: hypothetical protein AAB368_13565, partial [bacterium]
FASAAVVQRDLFHPRSAEPAAAGGVAEKTADDIRAALSLSAIVYNGREYLALIEERESGRGPAFCRVGDEVGGTRLVSIDESAGQAVVESRGRLRVALRLVSGATAGPAVGGD